MKDIQTTVLSEDTVENQEKESIPIGDAETVYKERKKTLERGIWKKIENHATQDPERVIFSYFDYNIDEVEPFIKKWGFNYTRTHGHWPTITVNLLENTKDTKEKVND